MFSVNVFVSIILSNCFDKISNSRPGN